MSDTSVQQQIKVASSLQVVTREGHLNGMLDAPDWLQLMRCSAQMKHCVKLGMNDGCVVIDELALALAPHDYKPILSTIGASFPKIKSLVIRGDAPALSVLNLPLWVMTQWMTRKRIAHLWELAWRRASLNQVPPPLNALCSIVAEGISFGTFMAVETSLIRHFENQAVAFPSLHTLKVSIHPGEHNKSYESANWQGIKPESLSLHMPGLTHLQWPYLLMPNDMSALIELSTRCTDCQPVWTSMVNQASALTRLSIEPFISTGDLRADSFAPLIQEMDLMLVDVTLHMPLPPTLVSLKCNTLRAVHPSHLSAKHLPSSLTLLHVDSDDSVLRDILSDLEHVPPNIWAQNHLPPKLHFLGKYIMMPQPLESLQIVSKKVQLKLHSLSAVYPNVMHFYTHLQLQYRMERGDGDNDDHRDQQLDEMTALAKIQSFIDMRNCKLHVADEMMKALDTLYRCRFDCMEARQGVVEEEALVKLLGECVTKGQLTHNKAHVDFTTYPLTPFEKETPTACMLACLQRWRAVARWVWPNVGVRCGVKLAPTTADADFLSTFSPLTCVAVWCSETLANPSFLSALQRNQTLHSVFIYCDDDLQASDCLPSVLSVMEHLPKCVHRLYVSLPFTMHCNAAFVARVPASVVRLEIDTNRRNRNKFPIHLPVWWSSVLRQIPPTTKSLHIQAPLTFLDVILIQSGQWLGRFYGAKRHSPLEITFKDDAGPIEHAIFATLIPIVKLLTICLSVVSVFSNMSTLGESITSIITLLLISVCMLFIQT